MQKTSTTKGTTNYTLHGKNVVHMANSANGIDMHFFYDAQNRPAIVIYNGTAYYYMHNLQGDIIHLVDANGNNVVNYVYDAWGKKLSATGSMAGSLGYWQPFRYRGYVYDEETGLYYLRSRYYNSNSNRFISSDSITINNIYSYTHNCPINGLDLDGYETKWVYDMLQEPEIANSIKQLPIHTKIKHLPIGSGVEYALIRIEGVNATMAYVASQTGIPLAMLQAVAYRETICYGVDDLLDKLPNHSKGLMQVKANTALTSYNYFNPRSTLSKESLETMLLQDDMSIYFSALTMKYWAEQYDIDLTNACEDEIGLVFSSYNSGLKMNKVGNYGKACLTYYRAFSRHTEVVPW